MEPFRKKNMLFGNWTTLILPVNKNDSIDYELLKDEIDFMIECHVDGIYSNGTAGEFYTQDREEFYTIQSILSEKCNRNNIPFQIGASHMSPQESLFRIAVARDMKPVAIQVILPDWFPVNIETAVKFLKNAAEESGGIPLVVYNPPHAKVTLEAEDWLAIISEVPSIIGIKVADGDSSWYKNMKEVMEKISVFIPGHHLATGIRQGALGAYSNMACLHPKGNQMWSDLIRSDLTAGLELEKRIRSFMEIYISPYLTRGYPNHACDKCMAVAGGWLPGLQTRLRFPYSYIPQDEAIEIGKIARREIPEFFNS